jgi:hypothetical protein
VSDGRLAGSCVARLPQSPPPESNTARLKHQALCTEPQRHEPCPQKYANSIHCASLCVRLLGDPEHTLCRTEWNVTLRQSQNLLHKCHMCRNTTHMLQHIHSGMPLLAEHLVACSNAVTVKRRNHGLCCRDMSGHLCIVPAYCVSSVGRIVCVCVLETNHDENSRPVCWVVKVENDIAHHIVFGTNMVRNHCHHVVLQCVLP